MGLIEDMIRAQRRLAGPSRGGASIHAVIPPKITSETVATIPSNRARIRVGVGESVTLTFAIDGATWTFTPPDAGTLSGTSGKTVTYKAPDRVNSVTFTATAGAATDSLTLTIVEPADVKMAPRPGTQGNHQIHKASAGFIADIWIMPADVSFENCYYLEKEVDGVGTGCFQQFYASGHHGHNPNTSPIPIGPPDNDTSGSKVNGYDKIAQSGSKCEGTVTHSIPWWFQVGQSGAGKFFKTVDQVASVTAAGDVTVTKAGGSNTEGYNDASEKDPLFN